MPDSRESLERQIDVCTWALLEPHIAKSDVFVVAATSDFLEVVVAIAKDDVELVKKLLADEALQRPSLEMLASYRLTPEKPFRMVVVKPFLLIQEVLQG